MKLKQITTILSLSLLLISGCSNETQNDIQNNSETITQENNTNIVNNNTNEDNTNTMNNNINKDTTDTTNNNINKDNSEITNNSTIKSNNETSDTTNIIVSQNSDIFSNRDFDIDYDENKSAIIQLNGDSATCSSNAVQISGSTITILDEGTYILSGTLNNGMIVVNSDKSDKTQLVLNGVTIHSETSAPIYILQSDKVFITLAPNTINTLSNGGTFTAIDENNIDSVIFSKEDITFNGTGSLTITSPSGHGIVSKDELTMTSGTYTITSSSHGITGKDNVCIANAAINIISGKDGIHAEHTDDALLGFVYIESGTFHIEAEGDGISATSTMQIENGTFDIVSGGGHENATQQTSEFWGGFGGRGPDGNKGNKGTDRNQGNPANNNITTTESDSTSIKGIKATSDFIINGGTFTIDSADDSIHSNTNVTVNGGTFQIASGDDAFHADETLSITSGTITISTSYEGLEGLHVKVSGGDIKLVATDDGINAAGGTDSSGFGGQRGNDRFGGGFGMSSSSNGSIEISNGTLYINASGDGIDANGTLLISGGNTIVCGPTRGDTATLDYDSSATITGGTFIGTGASGMAQTFSDSKQGVISLNVGNVSSGTLITLTDNNGTTLFSYAPELDFNILILSSPEMISGETYTVTIGSTSGTFEAN